MPGAWAPLEPKSPASAYVPTQGGRLDRFSGTACVSTLNPCQLYLTVRRPWPVRPARHLVANRDSEPPQRLLTRA
jgi:hypothetical protein